MPVNTQVFITIYSFIILDCLHLKHEKYPYRLLLFYCSFQTRSTCSFDNDKISSFFVDLFIKYINFSISFAHTLFCFLFVSKNCFASTRFFKACNFLYFFLSHSLAECVLCVFLFVKV